VASKYTQPHPNSFFPHLQASIFTEMGRRARTKQPPPELLEPKVFLTSKKLGKRKADSDNVDHSRGSRPTKKIKELDGKAKKKSPSKGKKNAIEFLSDEDDEMEGWEDVEDEVDFTTLTKLDVYFSPPRR
jgi:25S rRNA (cytosine2870-C5)-methyltransferase